MIRLILELWNVNYKNSAYVCIQQDYKTMS